MNYDAILAIFNCFKEKINYNTPEFNKKNNIPEDVKQWYEEYKEKNDKLKENIEENISSIKEGTNSECCIYYIGQREQNSRVLTNSPEKTKLLNSLIEKYRNEMIKKTIYNFLKNILNGIEILPFDVKNTEEKSLYECRVISKDSEQIKIDYDEDKLTTCIKISTTNKHLKITLLPEINSTHYDGMITLQTPNKKYQNFLKKIYNFFRKRDNFELENKELADFISITKEEISTKYQANGTIYSEEGIYLYEIKDNTFMINYFDQETINTILKTNFNKREELNSFIKPIRENKELANTDFVQKLEKYGLLPNATFSIPSSSKELQVLVNKAYLDSRTLISDLFKAK